MRLNDALITSEKYRGEPTTDEEGRTQWPVFILWDDEIKGFGVRIFPPLRGRPSRKDFIVTWKTGMRNRTMSIGTFGVDCTLRQARKVARDAIDLARRGQDPLEVRQRALGIGTAEDLASRFLFEHNAAAKKKPGMPGDEAAIAPAPELDGSSALAAPPEDSSSDAAADEAADAAATLAREPPAPESAAPELDEPAEDPRSTAPAAEVAAEAAEQPAAEKPDEEPAVSDDEAGAEPEPEPVFVTAPAAPPAPAAPLQAKTTPPGYRRPMHEASSRATAAPGAAAAPGAPTAPLVAEPVRRPPAPPPPPPLKRGPTKVRLLPVPEALYKVIEHGARESEMTISAYLNALIEIARAAVGETQGGGASPGADGRSADETGPSIRELFTQVQEAQAVEVGGTDQGDLER